MGGQKDSHFAIEPGVKWEWVVNLLLLSMAHLNDPMADHGVVGRINFILSLRCVLYTDIVKLKFCKLGDSLMIS